MTQWMRQHHSSLLGLATLLVLAKVVLDSLAAFGVLPPLGQDRAYDLLLLAMVVGVLPESKRQGAPGNWVARHPGWATVTAFIFVLGAAWTGIALERVWHAPLAARVVPDLLCVLALAFWIRDFMRRRGPLLLT